MCWAAVWARGLGDLAPWERLMSAQGHLASEQGMAVPKAESGSWDGEGVLCGKVGYYDFTFKVLCMIQSNWVTGGWQITVLCSVGALRPLHHWAKTH